MSKLLKANFMRLWKDKIFGVCIAVMGGKALYSAINCLYEVSKFGYEATLDNFFFDYATYILVLGAIFCSLFIGTEYSDGTIRNKLIMGYSRQKIYCANLIVCIIANLIMCLTHIAASLVGLSLGFYTSITETLVGVACSLMIVCSISALFTMISMLSKRKTVAAVICIVLTFLLLLYAYEVRNEVWLARTNGEQNVVYEFLYAFLPSCQSLQLSLDPETVFETSPIIVAICACVLFVSTTAIGLFLFKKKDLE